MIIIYDYEVFTCDVLLGAILVDDLGNETYYQTWNKDEIKEFFHQHINDIYISWNGMNYDRYITSAIMNNEDPYSVSASIVKSKFRPYCKFKYNEFDLMRMFQSPLSLKVTELIAGKSIETTEVPFNLPRPLNDEEKLRTEQYNRCDLDQTLYNFKMFKHNFELRIKLIEEFNLNLRESLNLTERQLSEKVLGAQRIEGIEYMKVKPVLYPNLMLKNERLKRFFLDEEFRQGNNDVISIGSISGINIGCGGLHQAIKKYHSEKVICYDISGAYNSVMINYDLLPRGIPLEGKELYKTLFEEQLRLKKIDPLKRKVYKVILLAVFGASNLNCPNNGFYDPQHGSLVTITCQLFICDLLEKLEGKAKIVQTNTDGIMLEPLDWSKEAEIDEIIRQWEERTKFKTHKDYLYNFWQRDVNCLMFQNDKGKVEAKGEAVINFDTSYEAYATGKLFNCTNPPIIALGVVNALINGKTPEETVNENKRNLIMFQHLCKKNTYDYIALEVDGEVKKLQGVDRAFASNDNKHIGMVYKYKTRLGKTSKAKIANLPMNVFIWDNSIIDRRIDEIVNKIDYQHYIDRIYERLEEFIEKEPEITLL